LSGFAAAVWTALEHQTGVIRHDGDEVNHVLEVEEEGAFGRTGSQSDDEFRGKPGVADCLGDEEWIDAGTARWVEPGHCLHAEHDDRIMLQRVRTDRERGRETETSVVVKDLRLKDEDKDEDLKIGPRGQGLSSRTTTLTETDRQTDKQRERAR